ncbi:MAG: deoxyguanosine kinase [Deltaproteobacteria bacterium RIFCSPLOWO2_02_FULL_46_8]|nr:MAG: deoxyguanosine kinase [Deltaproteobacteria bacterium RIFCSPLOWO2_02_FULL_46_8]
MSGRYIAIAGNMGVGKSSLVEFLCRHFQVKPFFEPNDKNPYLEDFYKDMKAYAFYSQLYFLSQKFKTYFDLVKSEGTVIQDRTIFEDAEIFATNLFKQGFISKRDFKIYKTFYQSIVKAFRPPDLLIYLKCSLPTIKKRIAKRGRGIEKEIPENYLRGLNKLYEQWIKRYKLSPVLVYPTDKLDYLSDFVHQQELLDKIEKYI